MTFRTRLGAILGRVMEAMLDRLGAPQGLDDEHYCGMGHSGAVTTARKPEPPADLAERTWARLEKQLEQERRDTLPVVPPCYCVWCRE
jgi:hypothetical protein